MFRFRVRSSRFSLPALLALACASAIASGAGAAPVSAEAGTVAEGPNAQGPRPLPDKRPPGWIAIEKVSDGCGQEGSLFRAHEQTYESDDGQTLTVDFNEACNLHDAAYSGAYVWDNINGRFVDFSKPVWTKREINEEFKKNLQRLCFRKFSGTDSRWEKALLQCLTSNDVRKGATWGALSFYDIVNSFFGASPRKRIKLTGQWKNTALGWPLCDLAVGRWTITQTGREVRAEWDHGTAGEHGTFSGTFITGGNEGDDVVDGRFTITRGKGGPKVKEGDMNFKVISAEKFDFNGAGAGGTMVQAGRSTQGRLPSAALPRCKRPASKPPAPPTQAGSFKLVASLTEVKNPNAPELTINAAGGTAVWDHTGQFGGAGKGGEWRVDFTFKVPQTLTPGKSSPLTLGLQVSNVRPEQPILFQVGARAPDFKGVFGVHYPNPAGASKTFAIPIPASYKDAKELIVIADVVSAEVIYHYRRGG
jgi:hypothetical protein